jgi:hypothetical protein
MDVMMFAGPLKCQIHVAHIFCVTLFSRDCDNRLFLITPEETGDLAYDVNFLCRTLLANLVNPGCAGVAIGSKFDFNQFMVLQGGFDLNHHVFIEAFVCNHHNGL